MRTFLSAVVIFPLLGLVACQSVAQTPTSVPPGPKATTTNLSVLDTGLYLKVPKTWKQKKVKKGIEVIIPEGKSAANVYLYSVDFRASSERWQVAQTNLALDMRRNLASQTTLDIGNIPLLLTETTYVDGTTQMNAQTGLYYAAARHKLMFRLESPSDVYTQAKTDWIGVFQTLQTTDGSVLVAEDPNRPLTADEASSKPEKVISTFTIKNGSGGPQPTKLPTITLETANRKITLAYPKPWTATQGNGNWSWNLVKPSIHLTMTISSTLDSPDPSTAMLTIAGQQLKDLAAVTSRNEWTFTNRYGASVDLLNRIGTSASNSKLQIQNVEGFVSKGEFYVIFQADSSKVLSNEAVEEIRKFLDSIDLNEVTQN